jgi:hypothetical protein
MIVAVTSMVASFSAAGTPTVTVYFDEALTARSMDRSGPGPYTLYVVAEGFDAYLTAIEYKIDYPAGMTWVADLDVPPITIGTTGEGIAQAWAEPVDGFSPVVVAKAVVKVDETRERGGVVAVKPHPVSGFVRATAAPDHRVIEAQGGTSLGRSNDRPSSRGSRPALDRAYPNPFNPVTQITFWIPRQSYVRLTVYDVSGRLVTTLVNDVRNGGEHTVGWRADDLSSSVYFCRLEVGDFVDHKKVMLLK